MQNSSFSNAFHHSIPILFSFIPLGFGFGYYGLQLGLPGYLVILMSMVIYAGSSEFLVATLLMKWVPAIDIIIAAALVNSRHIFYGLSVEKHYPKNWLQRFYMIHALTDETYSILATKKDTDYRFSFWLSVLNHAYWVSGVSLGVLTGHFASIKIEGLEFCLTALFIVLTMEKAYQIKKFFPFTLAIAAAIFSQYFFPKQMLLVAMILVTLFLIITYKVRGTKYGYE